MQTNINLANKYSKDRFFSNAKMLHLSKVIQTMIVMIVGCSDNDDDWQKWELNGAPHTALHTSQISMQTDQTKAIWNVDE